MAVNKESVSQVQANLPIVGNTEELEPPSSDKATPEFKYDPITGLCQNASGDIGLNKDGRIGQCSDLSGVDLSNKNLSGLDLSGSHFTNTILTNSDLSKSVVENTVFSHVDLSSAILEGVDLDKAILNEVILKIVPPVFSESQEAFLEQEDLPLTEVEIAADTSEAGHEIVAEQILENTIDVATEKEFAPEEAAFSDELSSNPQEIKKQIAELKLKSAEIQKNIESIKNQRAPYSEIIAKAKELIKQVRQESILPLNEQIKETKQEISLEKDRLEKIELVSRLKTLREKRSVFYDQIKQINEELANERAAIKIYNEKIREQRTTRKPILEKIKALRIHLKSLNKK